MWEENVKHMFIIGIYVDDCLIIDKKASFLTLIKELRKHNSNLKFENNVNEHLSCSIEESKDERKLTMIHPHLLTRLIQNSGEEIKCKRNFLTPGMPWFNIKSLTIEIDKLDAVHQKKYRSGVGMLLYLTKYSCPGICNIVRELSNTWTPQLGGLKMIS
jgi:hypothetical protein